MQRMHSSQPHAFSIGQAITVDLVMRRLTSYSRCIGPRRLRELSRASSPSLLATAFSLSSCPPSSLACRCEGYRSYTSNRKDYASALAKTGFAHIAAGKVEGQAEDSRATRWIFGRKT